MQEALETFLAASGPERQERFPRLLTGLRETIDAEKYDEAASVLRRVIFPTTDYTTGQTLLRLRQKLRGKTKVSRKIKLAVLGSFMTKQLVSFIDLHLFAAGVEAEVYEGE